MHKKIRNITIFFSLLVGLFFIVILLVWIWARPSTPDAFYNAPHTLPTKHGILLKQEPITKDVPQNAQGWRILYSTTTKDNDQTVASAIVIIPNKAANSEKPVIAYAHGTIGVVPGCAPSIVEEQFPNGSARALLEESVSNGWIFVSSDYAGLGTKGPHPFLIGEGEGRSVLDAIEALKGIKEVHSDGKVIIWGHSQGGHAALWSVILAKEYAPDLNILGVAALSPASNLIGLVQKAQDTAIGKILSSFIVTAYSEHYADVKFNEIVRPNAQFFTKDIASRCLSGKKTLLSAIEAEKLINGSIFSTDPSDGALGKRLTQNTPTKKISYPLFIGQGKSDDLVLPTIQNEFVKDYCKKGQDIDYRVYAGRDHLSVLAKDSNLISDLVNWTQERLEEKSVVPGCKVTQR